jgi:NADH-quinone oxidoreductase subunit N
MQIETLLLMRHEMVLVIIALIALFYEIFSKGNNKQKFIPIFIGIYFINTIIGFLPQSEGTIFGGMFVLSGVQLIMKNVLNIGVLIVLMQSAGWLKKAENKDNMLEFFVLLISTQIGMDYMISSGDFLMFYLGLELATIPIAILAAYERNKSKSAEAGIKLILSSALSSGILLFGISIFYMISGSIYFDEVATFMVNPNPLMALGLVFFFAGMSFKISLVPFHLWTADVYEGAPISVTSYLSVISKAAAAFIFTMILFKVFGQLAYLWKDIIYVLAVLTMTVGNLFAMRQQNLKRFLAFSSIAQAGFILLGIISADKIGLTAVIYFALVYIFSNLAAFGVVGAVSNFSGKETIKEYNGLYKTNPKLSLVMMLALFSLAGIPPVAGFFGKFFLFTSAAQGGYYWLILIAVLNATISLYYYLLVIRAMFIESNETPVPNFKSDFFMRTGIVISVLGIFIIGFIGPIWDYIKVVVDSF